VNLLAWKPVRLFVTSPWFPVGLQAATLAAVVGLVVNGWGVGLDKNPDELLLFRKTHLTTLMVWGLWWPGLIALTLVFGRVWCTICPMELVNRVGDAIARKVGWPRIRMGRFPPRNRRRRRLPPPLCHSAPCPSSRLTAATAL